MLLSAAVIVKDDTDRLDACLTSLRGLVDEIVVVDTASSDESVAVAQGHGALVAREPWQGDWSTARNRSLDLASGDWILHIDADELLTGQLTAAREVLAAADDCIACEVRFVPQIGWTPLRQVRLWRNLDDIRFVGRVHETVVPAVDAAADEEHLRVEHLNGLTIRHDDAEEGRAERRARDERVLLAELERDPDRAPVYDHLARVYEAAGDGERALTTWKRGISVVRTRGLMHPDDRVLYIDLVHHLLAHGVLDDELEAVVGEARAQFDRTPTLELAAARLAFATGRPRDALEPLEWLVGLDDDAIMATGASYDERVFGEWAWSLLGLCHFALGDDVAAADAFGHAEEFAPDDASYSARRRLAEARASTSAS